MLFKTQDIAEYVSINHDISKDLAYKIVRDVFRFVAFALTNGACVSAVGLGIFRFRQISEVKEGQRICPLTKQPMQGTPAHSTPSIKYYHSLIDKVKQNSMGKPFKNCRNKSCPED